jgi:hypothetical protein
MWRGLGLPAAQPPLKNLTGRLPPFAMSWQRIVFTHDVAYNP